MYSKARDKYCPKSWDQYINFNRSFGVCLCWHGHFSVLKPRNWLFLNLLVYIFLYNIILYHNIWQNYFLHSCFTALSNHLVHSTSLEIYAWFQIQISCVFTVGYHIAFYGANFRHQLIFLTSPAAKWIPDRHTNRIRAENSLGKGN